MTPKEANIKIEELAEKVTERIAELLKKGMPAESYVAPPFAPDETGNINLQAAMYAIKTMRLDLPQMFLNEEEKEQMITCLDIAEWLFIQLEEIRITKQLVINMSTAIQFFLEKRKANNFLNNKAAS